MFLSKLVLNVRSEFARRDLARPYEMHRTLWSAFGQKKWNWSDRQKPLGEPAELLFRVDADPCGGMPTVLVQSQAEPDWSALPAGYAIDVSPPKPFAVAVSVGQRLRFRLRANPTKRLREASVHANGSPIEPRWVGKRVGLLTEADRLRWLVRKSENGGFRIPGAWVKASHPLTGEEVELPNFRVDAIPEGRFGNGKRGSDGGFVAVRFEGVLEVTDPAALAAIVAAGIGSGKGYGFGLLSLAPA